MADLVIAGLNSMLVGVKVLDKQTTSGSQAPNLDLHAIHSFSLVTKYTSDPKAVLASGGSTSGDSTSDPHHHIVNVQTLTGKKIKIPFAKDSADKVLVHSLKLSIEDKEGIPPYQQRLIFNNKELQNDKFLFTDYQNVLHGPIHMIIRCRGGGDVTYLFDCSILDPAYNFEYPVSDSQNFKRGDRAFERPCGWSKKALKVLGKYENDAWLGTTGRTSQTNSVEKEWPVSYHGTDQKFAEDIANKGYDISCGKRFAYGLGIYSTPTPKIAEGYAHVFTYQGTNYKMIIMNRVNFTSTKEVYVNGIGTYFVTSEDKDVRPYAFLFKKI